MKMKECAYMVTKKSEAGFSFASLLLTITIVFTTLPFMAYLLEHININTHEEFISVHQFFNYVRDELIESEHYHTSHDTISYQLENGDTGTFSKYQNLVRRQVNKKGHEVYLRDVQHIQIQPVKYGIHLSITSMRGNVYEKTIILHK